MAKLTDIPFGLLPFITLVHLTTLSKECYMISREALKFKNRGDELLAYFASVPLERRKDLIMYSTNMYDMWSMWQQLGIKMFGKRVNAFVFLDVAPCNVSVSTIIRDQEFDIGVSSHHIINIDTPYAMFCRIHPNVTAAINSLVDTINSMFGDTQYDDVSWQTSPISFFEIDLVYMACYRHDRLVINYQEDFVHTDMMLFDYFRVSGNSMREYLPLLLE